jgi:hypothetical protein
MTSDQLLQVLPTLVGERGEVRRGSADGVTIALSDGRQIDVRADPSQQRLVLEHRFQHSGPEVRWRSDELGMGEAARLPQFIARIIESRPALLDGVAEETADGYEVRLWTIVYDDTVTRHAVLGGVDELLRARTTIERQVVEAAAQMAGLVEYRAGTDALWQQLAQPVAGAAPAGDGPGTTAASTPVAATSTSTATAATAAVDAVPPPPSSTPPGSTGASFRGTHIPPARGLPAWNTPDGSTPVAAQLEPGIPLEVVERRGDWAHVRAVNGWHGWVDGRRLLPLPPGGA